MPPTYHQSDMVGGIVEISIGKCRIASLIFEFLGPDLPVVGVEGVVREAPLWKNPVAVSAPLLKSANSCKT